MFGVCKHLHVYSTHVMCVFLHVCSTALLSFLPLQNNWVPRKIAAANMPTTIDKIHGESRRREEWRTTDSRRPPLQTQPEKIDSDRLRRLHTRVSFICWSLSFSAPTEAIRMYVAFCVCTYVRTETVAL